MSDFRNQVLEAFNHHQVAGWFHPYTCANPEHSWRDDDPATTLHAVAQEGDVYLVCHCGYQQRMTAFDAFLVAGVAAQGDPFHQDDPIEAADRKGYERGWAEAHTIADLLQTRIIELLAAYDVGDIPSFTAALDELRPPWRADA